MSEDGLRAAVAAGAMAGEQGHQELLQSVVEAARAIFRAKASSILLYDEGPDELVFAAVAGEGSDTLIGNRFSSAEGVAGWVLRAREPLVLEDVEQDPRFARGVAQSTGYVPRGLMAVPLLREDRALGVLSVLDRPAEIAFTTAEMNLLALFGRQAAIAVDVVEHAREAQAMLSGEGQAAVVARIAGRLEEAEGPRREAGLRLLGALEALLG